jgi:hypothetical protein
MSPTRHDDDEPRDARAEMAAVIVHQLRNRMSRVLFGLEAIVAGSAHVPQLSPAANRLRRGIDDLTATFDQLIELARVLSGTSVVRAERLNLVGLVEGCIERKRSLFRALEHALEVDLPTEALWVDADRLAMELAVENLLTNAAKFTPQRGHVQVGVALAGDLAEVRVSDDGVGIERERLAHLFEGRPAPGGREEGRPRGISAGLLLVHRVAQLHGGDAMIDSAGPGRGTAARLLVPCVAQPARAPQRVPRALIVHGEAAVTASLLRSWGYQVTSEREDNAAMALLPSFAPELIVVGPRGAVHDSLLAERLRAATPARLVLLGGDPRTPGFDRTVPMPIDVDLLHAAVLGIER